MNSERFERHRDSDFDIRQLAHQEISGIRLYGAVDSPSADGVLLELQDSSVSIAINHADDSLYWKKGNTFPQDDGQIEKTTTGLQNYFGVIVFIWAMRNQGGCLDALQIEVLSKEGGYKTLQFMGAASMISLHSLVAMPVELLAP